MLLPNSLGPLVNARGRLGAGEISMGSTWLEISWGKATLSREGEWSDIVEANETSSSEDKKASASSRGGFENHWLRFRVSAGGAR